MVCPQASSYPVDQGHKLRSFWCTGGRYHNDKGTAGEAVHKKWVTAGFTMKFLASETLGRYIRHLNHATMILNPRPGDRKTSKKKARKRIAKELGFSGYRELISGEGDK